MFFCLSASVMAQNTTEITLKPIVVTATRIEAPLTHRQSYNPDFRAGD